MRVIYKYLGAQKSRFMAVCEALRFWGRYGAMVCAFVAFVRVFASCGVLGLGFALRSRVWFAVLVRSGYDVGSIALVRVALRELGGVHPGV